MTSSFNAVCTAGCFAVAMLAGSCKKELKPPAIVENTSAPKGLEVRKCQIIGITVFNSFLGNKTISFEYNQRGDPVSVTPSVIEDNSPQLLFRYDHKGRLTDYIVSTSSGNYLFWYRYVYGKQNKIIQDTLYFGGTIAGGPASALLTGWEDYTYDDEGRITRIQAFGYVPIGIGEFEYDANGNLASSNARYDDQVSLLRTNEIWMFISRNYSRNNAIPATSYNSAGLPLAFNTDPLPYWFFLYWLLNYSSVEYTCKGNVN
jgi:hypothetical protein